MNNGGQTCHYSEKNTKRCVLINAYLFNPRLLCSSPKSSYFFFSSTNQKPSPLFSFFFFFFHFYAQIKVAKIQISTTFTHRFPNFVSLFRSSQYFGNNSSLFYFFRFQLLISIFKNQGLNHENYVIEFMDLHLRIDLMLL